MIDRLGQRLGHYHLIRLLGEGGFARVYQGEHIYLKTLAAIKVLKEQLSGQDQQKFFDEALTIAHLIHPHIVRLLDYDVDGNIPFMVMDFAPNGTLQNRHPPRTQLPLITIVSYITQVADALQYAHDGKLIHRDIKPANMLIGKRNEILLSDFGIAVIARSTRSQKTEEVIGTWTYTAPEVFKGKPQPASDQYALGIIVYEWLCGLPPFQGSFAELYNQHLSVPPPLLRTKIPTIPSMVEEVVLKALAKDPQQRFETVQDFAHALEQGSLVHRSTTFEVPPNSPPLPPLPPTQPAISLGKCLYRSMLSNSKLCLAAWSPQKPYIAFLYDSQQINVVNGSNRNTIFTYRRPFNMFKWLTQRRHLASIFPSVTYIAWSPREPLLAMSFDDCIVEVWNIETMSKLSTYQHDYPVTNLTWSPDGIRIISKVEDNDTSYSFVIRQASAEYYDFTFYPNYVSGKRDFDIIAKWSPDGQRIAFHYYYSTQESLRRSAPPPERYVVEVWDVASRGKMFTYRHPQMVTSVTWLTDGQHLASTSTDGILRAWDTRTGNCNIIHDNCFAPIAWSPDEMYIAANYDRKATIRVLDLRTGSTACIFKTGYKELHRIQWLPDMEHIICWGQEVLVRNINSDETVFRYLGDLVKLSPDGTCLASASSDRTLQIWNASTGKLIFTFPGLADRIATLEWSPDGTLIATTSWLSLEIWQAMS